MRVLATRKLGTRDLDLPIRPTNVPEVVPEGNSSESPLPLHISDDQHDPIQHRESAPSSLSANTNANTSGTQTVALPDCLEPSHPEQSSEQTTPPIQDREPQQSTELAEQTPRAEIRSLSTS